MDGLERRTRIGIISDTHGHLSTDALLALVGVDHIIHAGDIGDSSIIEELRGIAPVTAVTGNQDRGALCEDLPSEADFEVRGIRIVVGHKRKRLMKRLAAGKVGVGSNGDRPKLIVFGHEHMPSVEWTDDRLHLCPGSASAPYEEDDTPTVAIVEKTETGLSVLLIPLAREYPATDGS